MSIDDFSSSFPTTKSDIHSNIKIRTEISGLGTPADAVATNPRTKLRTFIVKVLWCREGKCRPIYDDNGGNAKCDLRDSRFAIFSREMTSSKLTHKMKKGDEEGEPDIESSQSNPARSVAWRGAWRKK